MRRVTTKRIIMNSISICLLLINFYALGALGYHTELMRRYDSGEKMFREQPTVVEAMLYPREIVSLLFERYDESSQNIMFKIKENFKNSQTQIDSLVSRSTSSLLR